MGETRSPLSSRLGTGFKAFQKEEGINGYHGYKWINNFKNSKKLLTVNVFRFEHLKDCSELNDFFDDLGLQVKDKRKTIIEAIEAEIVFNVRNETGKWCKFQHEIHFHNLGDVIKNVAYKIYEF